jgi:uncharacterized protein (TIGR00251 family)
LIRLAVKVTPKASADRIQGWAEDEAGERVLKIAVTAVPEDGKVNKAVIALLAKRLKLPKSAITIASGETARRKSLLIDGDDALLAQLPTEQG